MRTGAINSRGQAMVEFALTVGLLMLVVVLTAGLALYLHYRSDLETAAREGAFEASLVGHTPEDGRRTTLELWSRLEPGSSAIQVDVSRSGNLIVVTARGTAYGGLPVHAQADHSIERFQAGSA
jgi:Flp pilus assembly protein TadG